MVLNEKNIKQLRIDNYTASSFNEKDRIKRQLLDKLNKGSDEWNRWVEQLKEMIGEPEKYILDFSLKEIDKCDFSDYIFPCKVSFEHSKFKSDLRLIKTKFFTDVTFKKSSFYKKIQADGLVFNGDVSFDESKFNGVVDLQNTVFTKSASFRECRFKKSLFMAFLEISTKGSSLTFYSSEFFEGVIINDLSINGSLVSEKAKFYKSSTFLKNKIRDMTCFREAIFEERVVFQSSEFNGEVYFDLATFKKFTEFNNVFFKSEVNFKSSKFKSQVVFQGVRFENSIPEFNFSEFLQPPNLTTIKLNVSKEILKNSMPTTFRKLKQMAIQSSDFENELRFYGYETDAKQYQDTTPFGQKIFIRLYKLFSNFGQSISRPISSLIVFIVVMCLINAIYMTNFNSISESCKNSKVLFIGTVVQYTLSESSPLFSLDKEQAQVVENCLFNNKSLDVRNSLWRQVHFIPTTFFIFLFGLGLRNRFKIK